MKDGLQSALLEAIVRVGWTHKIQEKQAEAYQSSNRWLTLIQLVTAGLTSTGAITTLINNSYYAKIFTALVGLISFISTGILKAWDFQALAKQSKVYANNQLKLRDQLIDTLRDLAFGLKSDKEIKLIWEKLEQERFSLYSEAVPTSDRSVDKANKQLKERHDNEINTDYNLFISSEILEKLKVDNYKGESRK
ncbi:SLATT domain-containing protein [Latilactobacillus sakei subsp. carnosus]|uniref:SMODS and SLOG-associating 2TM effector domain-containing protein n=1 Tax=Latilactobacillus sakei TaxID=1599 RepID=A0A0C5PWU4_LATSK|nr:SLATT domain-containing protein [Latilactobacillus sakei]AJQ16938.1 hypothetical protein [Latilactobacillus sakei]MCM1572078.1 SLATT domain-containing protein [Latilactobacillus sakei]MCM1598887.1 SLATT domain-containing protein [Latilactobacillus sakei]MCP8852766.1 SLATT domain-containing protein [Latilactobacillus sakei]SOE45454.1 Plasmid hypothetical protein [Latilactobacillus sakei]